MATLNESLQAQMGGPVQSAAVGDAWDQVSNFLAADGQNFEAVPDEDARVAGTNAPEITNMGWRRMVRRMQMAKGV